MTFLKPKTIIAGPCSVETWDQLYSTTKGLLETSRLDILRAGVWKPRTSPNSFEGLGVQALEWLQRIKEEFSLEVAIEVAHPKHIDLALSHGISTLWLGARTTVSPFSVQEIANALKGTDCSLFIKNPINPDVKLWAGATERILQAGIQNVALIHRGFSHFHKTLRYPPLWHLALQMRNIHPRLPMICDPSHIAGRRDSIQEIAQHALNLGMDGLMLESHHKPEEAWSDAAQQITPEKLSSILSSLEWEDLQENLLEKRFSHSRKMEIHQIDMEIEELIRRRDSLLRENQQISLVR